VNDEWERAMVVVDYGYSYCHMGWNVREESREEGRMTPWLKKRQTPPTS
jgi:hypothetical protein